jgi:hypothetical protein
VAGSARKGPTPPPSVFRPKGRADMQRLAPIPRFLRSELTSAFHGVIQGLWTPRSPTDCGPRRLPLVLPLGLPLVLPLEIAPKRPLCPPQRGLCGLGFCRHLCVTRCSAGIGASLSSSLGPRAPRARRLRHLLRAGCSASVRNRRAPAHRLRGGVLVGRQRGAHHQSRRERGCARSARVLAVKRREADLDRFVAALLALATDPDCERSRLRRPSPRTPRR